MNNVLEFLNSHGSVRSFADDDVRTEDERIICSTAQRSPTSSNLQAYSIVAVRNVDTKNRLAELCGNQEHVAACPLFLIFCADLHRLADINRQKGYTFHGDTTEMFIVSTVDATLAAGRALTAAQAMGLGGVMVGGIRNQPDEVSALLQLPNLVYPVMGMSLGRPLKTPAVKPRISFEGVHFEEVYDEEACARAVEAYDQTIAKLGNLRGREVDSEAYPEFTGEYSWSEHSARRLASASPAAQRVHMRPYLQRRGFLLK